eukprot:COSAG03_NODE_28993_length_191_cov_144.163043_1_plen_43_part_10
MMSLARACSSGGPPTTRACAPRAATAAGRFPGRVNIWGFWVFD